jgi:hypothetical protein
MSMPTASPAIFEHGEVVPPRRVATPMWLRAALYWGYQYKRTWRSSVFTSFLIPVLYLTSLGVALGSLIDKHSHGVDGVSYVAYPGPGPAGRHLHADRHQRHHVAGHGGHQVDAHLPGHAGRTPGRLRRPARPPGLGGDPHRHRGDHLPGRHGRLRDRPFSPGPSWPCRPACSPAWPSPCPDGRLLRHAGQGHRLLDALPLRGDPAVPVLGHLLPDLAAAAGPPVPGLRHAALPRRRPLP